MNICLLYTSRYVNPVVGGCGYMFASTTSTVNFNPISGFSLSAVVDGGDFTDGEGGPLGSGSATASGTFSDEMVLYGGTGIADLQWTYTDSYSADFNSSTLVPFIVNLPTQVTFGVPFDISYTAQIQVIPGPLFAFYDTSIAKATFDLYGLQVNGSYRGFQYGDASGIAYLGSGGTFVSTDAFVTPEPSYFWSMAVILGAFLLARSRWR